MMVFYINYERARLLRFAFLRFSSTNCSFFSTGSIIVFLTPKASVATAAEITPAPDKKPLVNFFIIHLSLRLMENDSPYLYFTIVSLISLKIPYNKDEVKKNKESRIELQKVLVIAGPTAVGKTALSIELAQKLNGEIISGDSMQVYKGLDIGTAKVTPQEMQGIPHHLIDIIQPDEPYSAADFQKQGRRCIDEIAHRGHLPIIVGGTGLYLQTLLYDFHLGGQQVEIPESKKRELEGFATKYGKEELWNRLYKQDEAAARAIHPNNQRRVLRALEVVETTHRPFLQKEEQRPLYDIQLIILNTDRQLLYDRINQRVDLMMEQGLLEEARYALSFKESQSRRGIGYKEFEPYLNGEITLEEAVEQVKQNSRRYAKRQLTWFRNRMSGTFYDLVCHPENQAILEENLKQWLEES